MDLGDLASGGIGLLALIVVAGREDLGEKMRQKAGDVGAGVPCVELVPVGAGQRGEERGLVDAAGLGLLEEEEDALEAQARRRLLVVGGGVERVEAAAEEGEVEEGHEHGVEVLGGAGALGAREAALLEGARGAGEVLVDAGVGLYRLRVGLDADVQDQDVVLQQVPGLGLGLLGDEVTESPIRLFRSKCMFY